MTVIHLDATTGFRHPLNSAAYWRGCIANRTDCLAQAIERGDWPEATRHARILRDYEEALKGAWK